jgi:serine/threonine-protein kinase
MTAWSWGSACELLGGPLDAAELDRLIMKPTARRRLGKYVLLGRLGAGGMGKIYLGHAPGPAGIDKLMVVKRLHSHLTNDPVLVNSFLDEARLSMALNHQNIVHTYDVGEVDGRYFMVMEYIDGQNLGVVLRTAKRSGAYPKSATWAGLFISVLAGLHAAHTARDARGRSLHIIHRDVSPQNILITYDGLPKLVDFGIAKAAMRVSETDAGTLKGKYAYMSPEQVRGDELDARSDVFAAGIVLWEMLAGRRLYKAETIVRSVERILNEPLISPVRVNPACDPGLASVVLKALEKRREDRFPSAEAFRAALEDALDHAGVRYRAAEGRDLMQRLFADVIEGQRAMLDSILNRADDGPVDDDEEDSRRFSDSQSDLRVPDLQIRETSTPSSSLLRGSPLVTAEGDPEPPKPRVATRAPPPVTVSTGPLSPSPQSVLAPPLDSVDNVDTRDLRRPASKAKAVASDAVTATGIVIPDDPGDRRRAMWVPALAAAVGVFLAVGAVAIIRRFEAAELTAALTAPPPPTAVAVVPPPAPPLTEDAAPIVDAAVADGAAVADVVADAADADVADADVVDGDVVDGDVVADGDAAVAVAKPNRKRRPPRRVTPPEPRVETPPRPAPEPAVVVEEGGFLTLDTVPWTTVYLGKRKLGETPLVKVPVPAGALELTLVNAESNVREGYLANVKAGQVFRTRLDLR